MTDKDQTKIFKISMICVFTKILLLFIYCCWWWCWFYRCSCCFCYCLSWCFCCLLLLYYSIVFLNCNQVSKVRLDLKQLDSIKLKQRQGYKQDSAKQDSHTKLTKQALQAIWAIRSPSLLNFFLHLSIFWKGHWLFNCSKVMRCLTHEHQFSPD